MHIGPILTRTTILTLVELHGNERNRIFFLIHSSFCQFFNDYKMKKSPNLHIRHCIILLMHLIMVVKYWRNQPKNWRNLGFLDIYCLNNIVYQKMVLTMKPRDPITQQLSQHYPSQIIIQILLLPTLRQEIANKILLLLLFLSLLISLLLIINCSLP